MRRVVTLLLWALVFSTTAHAEETPYQEQVRATRALAKASPKMTDAALERALVAQMDGLFSHWYGTTWGLGGPQTQTPGSGKINCGMFVGRTLVDAGVNVRHKKLQRQPAELIIKSLVPKRLIRRFRRKPMPTFLEGVRAMGPGLYIIGLDFHVGFLKVEDDGDVRFIHASYVTKTVLDEPAAQAVPIKTSKYRVVGKLFAPELLSKWRAGRRVKVLGRW